MEKVLSIEIINKLNIKMDLLSDSILIFLGTIFIALCSRFAFYTPFSPVPITGQTFAVLLTGAILGYKRGALSVLLYVLEGLSGLPVFAGGTSGIVVLTGPTFGYLIGFIFGGALVGFLAEKGSDKRWYTMALAFCIGQATIYLFGILRLSSFVGLENAYAMGIAPFLVGDFLKAGLVMILLPSTWKLLK